MSDNTFNHIAQEVLKQQQFMRELEAENRELRRQLSDLRAGHGIFLEVAGQRFPLWGGVQVPHPVTTSAIVQEDFPVPVSQETPAPTIFEKEEAEEVASVTEVTPTQKEEEDEKQKVPTFLEEIMIGEFAAASTSPLAVWAGPVDKQIPASMEEEQKAALRRELMGSFLLE